MNHNYIEFELALFQHSICVVGTKTTKRNILICWSTITILKTCKSIKYITCTRDLIYSFIYISQKLYISQTIAKSLCLRTITIKQYHVCVNGSVTITLF